MLLLKEWLGNVHRIVYNTIYTVSIWEKMYMTMFKGGYLAKLF